MCCSVRCPQRSLCAASIAALRTAHATAPARSLVANACGDAGCSVSKLTRLAPHPLQDFSASPLIERERTEVRGLLYRSIALDETLTLPLSLARERRPVRARRVVLTLPN